jgi:sugar O-acyltransferase (sialic acid O-acetyltransferase NeuD family)
MNVILIGGFSEIIELCENCRIDVVGIIDTNTIKKSQYPILGDDTDAEKIFAKYGSVPIIISPDIPQVRKKLAKYYYSIGYKFFNLISPKAEISRSANIGKGVVIQSGVNISSNVQIGEFVKLNIQSNIMHDCSVDNYVTIAPNAVLLGRVKIECECYIGANSTILPDLIVRNNAIVGAGAVVAKEVCENSIVKGIRAK